MQNEVVELRKALSDAERRAEEAEASARAAAETAQEEAERCEAATARVRRAEARAAEAEAEAASANRRIREAETEAAKLRARVRVEGEAEADDRETRVALEEDRARLEGEAAAAKAEARRLQRRLAAAEEERVATAAALASSMAGGGGGGSFTAGSTAGVGGAGGAGGVYGGGGDSFSTAWDAPSILREHEVGAGTRASAGGEMFARRGASTGTGTGAGAGAGVGAGAAGTGVAWSRRRGDGGVARHTAGSTRFESDWARGTAGSAMAGDRPSAAARGDADGVGDSELDAREDGLGASFASQASRSRVAISRTGSIRIDVDRAPQPEGFVEGSVAGVPVSQGGAAAGGSVGRSRGPLRPSASLLDDVSFAGPDEGVAPDDRSSGRPGEASAGRQRYTPSRGAAHDAAGPEASDARSGDDGDDASAGGAAAPAAAGTGTASAGGGAGGGASGGAGAGRHPSRAGPSPATRRLQERLRRVQGRFAAIGSDD